MSNNTQNQYSVVVPVYNEEESVEPLFSEIHKALSPLDGDFEVVFVDDCSSDKTPSILAGLKREISE